MKHELKVGAIIELDDGCHGKVTAIEGRNITYCFADGWTGRCDREYVRRVVFPAECGEEIIAQKTERAGSVEITKTIYGEASPDDNAVAFAADIKLLTGTCAFWEALQIVETWREKAGQHDANERRLTLFAEENSELRVKLQNISNVLNNRS